MNRINLVNKIDIQTQVYGNQLPATKSPTVFEIKGSFLVESLKKRIDYLVDLVNKTKSISFLGFSKASLVGTVLRLESEDGKNVKNIQLPISGQGGGGSPSTPSIDYVDQEIKKLEDRLTQFVATVGTELIIDPKQGKAYQVNKIVSYKGNLYKCIKDISSYDSVLNNPITDIDSWDNITKSFDLSPVLTLINDIKKSITDLTNRLPDKDESFYYEGYSAVVVDSIPKNLMNYRFRFQGDSAINQVLPDPKDVNEFATLSVTNLNNADLTLSVLGNQINGGSTYKILPNSTVVFNRFKDNGQLMWEEFVSSKEIGTDSNNQNIVPLKYVKNGTSADVLAIQNSPMIDWSVDSTKTAFAFMNPDFHVQTGTLDHSLRVIDDRTAIIGSDVDINFGSKVCETQIYTRDDLTDKAFVLNDSALDPNVETDKYYIDASIFIDEVLPKDATVTFTLVDVDTKKTIKNISKQGRFKKVIISDGVKPIGLIELFGIVEIRKETKVQARIITSEQVSFSVESIDKGSHLMYQRLTANQRTSLSLIELRNIIKSNIYFTCKSYAQIFNMSSEYRYIKDVAKQEIPANTNADSLDGLHLYTPTGCNFEFRNDRIYLSSLDGRDSQPTDYNVGIIIQDDVLEDLKGKRLKAIAAIGSRVNAFEFAFFKYTGDTPLQNPKIVTGYGVPSTGGGDQRLFETGWEIVGTKAFEPPHADGDTYVVSISEVVPDDCSMFGAIIYPINPEIPQDAEIDQILLQVDGQPVTLEWEIRRQKTK